MRERLKRVWEIISDLESAWEVVKWVGWLVAFAFALGAYFHPKEFVKKIITGAGDAGTAYATAAEVATFREQQRERDANQDAAAAIFSAKLDIVGENVREVMEKNDRILFLLAGQTDGGRRKR